MKKYDLSVIIPSCNEMFLKRTIEDILEKMEGNTEIIAVLDEQWADPPIPDHPKVTLVYLPERVGHRVATNVAAKLSKAKYLMKMDAHCAFDQGFDVKMMKEMKDNWTMVPIMKNLHAFDWVCEDCDWRKYQGPTPEKCEKCGSLKVKRDMIWRGKPSPNSKSYCVDNSLHFQYFGDWNKRLEGQGDITETMSLQGSCFMVTRDKYFELELCDEEWGMWGQQGAEVALKTWLSGGRVVCNWKTWYAHMFRTQGGDFGFPYKLWGTSRVRALSRDIFLNNKWEKQIHPFSWLLEKFWPIRGWTDEDLKKQKERDKETFKKQIKKTKKGIIYYTTNQLQLKIARKVQNNLTKISREKDIPIVSASLKPMAFGDKNVYLPLDRGYLTMFKQILAGLEASRAEIIFFAEHDVLYHKSHFDFTPPKKDVFYYNENVWFLRPDGHCLHYDAKQLSGLCAYRDVLITHFRERVEMVKRKGFSRRMGFEPMTHGRIKWKNMYKAEGWKSKFPNVDIKHGETATPGRWKKEQFRNQRYTKGWKEAREIPGWGKGKEILL